MRWYLSATLGRGDTTLEPDSVSLILPLKWYSTSFSSLSIFSMPRGITEKTNEAGQDYSLTILPDWYVSMGVKGVSWSREHISWLFRPRDACAMTTHLASRPENTEVQS